MFDLILCNTIFDKENDNVLLFNSKAEMQTYFNNLSDKQIIENINFNANDGINTTVYVRLSDGLSLFKLLNYNYCIVRQKDTNEDLFYFIDKSYQDSSNQIRLDLKLDVFNSYIIDLIFNGKALNGLITRTHLNRFIKNGEDYILNFAEDSPLFEREQIKNVSQRVTAKQDLKSQIDLSAQNSNFNNWVNDNVVCWVYFYLSANVEYNFINQNNESQTRELTQLNYFLKDDTDTTGDNRILSNFVVLCAPIYKNNKRIKFSKDSSSSQYEWNIYAIRQILNLNNKYANVQSIKFSKMPPFPLYNYEENVDYSINNNLIFYASDITSPLYKYNFDGNHFLSGRQSETRSVCFNMSLAVNTTKLFIENEFDKWEYTKDEILQNNKIEPKLFNEDYATYKLFIGGQQYLLPISKTSNKPSFIYKEALTPDITKGILIYDTDSNKFNNNVFNENTKNDFTGFNFTIDLSIWFPSNNLDNYLASNKNYLQIFNNQQTEKLLNVILSVLTKSGTGAISGAFSGGTTGAMTGGIMGAISGGISIGNTMLSNYFDKANFDLNIDNMKNTPEQTSNINSNPIFIDAVSGLNIFIEKLAPLSFEQSIIIDNLKMFGYTYNCIGNINDYIKSRKYYNYIQAVIFDIDAHIGEAIKDMIKTTFLNGIRFWHASNFAGIDYNLNNYETIVEQ